MVRDRMLQQWISTAAAYTRNGSRTVAYLSAEFLTGPHLGNNLVNLGIHGDAEQATAELGLSLDELPNEEQEPGLGNGGLGRLAACFLDSMASLEIPSLGYGIRYEFGIFDQEIVDGWQVERTDTSLFRPLIDDLLDADPYIVMADYAAFADARNASVAPSRTARRGLGCPS